MVEITLKGRPVHIIGEEPDYEKTLAVLQGGERMDSCTTTSTAEYSRGFEDDEPCDDGRAG